MGETREFGCHCDLEPGQLPDGCVLDYGRPEDCVYAGKLAKREDCKYWLPCEQTAEAREIDALRAQVSEKDREIERLTATNKILSDEMLDIGELVGGDGDVYTRVRIVADSLSASQAREREAREEARINLESAKAEAIDRDAMLARAMQAEAREREAVERAGGPADEANPNGSLYARLKWWKDRDDETQDALAAARKALEDLASAILRKNADGKPMHSRQGLNNIARAALNGDGHAE